ncbi:hypothetical protein ACFLQV_03985 [Calditrichota bacterium]
MSEDKQIEQHDPTTEEKVHQRQTQYYCGCGKYRGRMMILGMVLGYGGGYLLAVNGFVNHDWMANGMLIGVAVGMLVGHLMDRREMRKGNAAC